MVLLERNLHEHPIAGLLGKTIRGSFNGIWMEKVPNWECLFVHRNHGLLLSVYVDDIKKGWKEAEYGPMWKKQMKLVDLREPTSFLDHIHFGYTQRECKPNESTSDEYKNIFEPRTSAGATDNTGMGIPHAKKVPWSNEMEGHAKNSGKILRDGKQKKRATVQSLCSMLG